MPMMRRMLHMTDTDSRSSDTVEPSYRYEATHTAGYFEIDMPGVSREDLSVEVHDNKLCVRGKRFRKELIPQREDDVEDAGKDAPGEDKQEDGMEDAGKEGTAEAEKEEPVPSIVYLLEMRLTQGADVDAIKADAYEDGVLTMTVPMKTDKGTRRVQIEF